MEHQVISVIIPVYNTGAKAVKLIDFLLNKDQYQQLEIIVVDDGSTDDSLKLLKAIKSPKLKVLHQSNAGPAAARNYGLKKVTGDYISFIDSDDFIKPSFHARLIKQFAKPDISLAMTGVEYHRVKDGTSFPAYPAPQPPRNNGESYQAYILRLMNLDGRLYSVTNKLFLSAPIKKHQLKFDTSMNFAEDTKFVLEYLSLPENREQEIAWVKEPLFIYNYGTSTSTVASSSLDWRNWQKSYDFLETWLGKTPGRAERKNLKKLYFRWKISHALALARANLPLEQKLEHINIFALALAKVAVKLRR